MGVRGGVRLSRLMVDGGLFEARRLCCVCRLLVAGLDAICDFSSIGHDAWVWGSVNDRGKS